MFFINKHNTSMKTATKILLGLFIATLIPAIIFGRSLFYAIIPTQDGFLFDFDVYAYLGMAFLLANNILGGILYFRFIASLKLPKAIFFSVFPITIMYGFGLYSLAIVGKYTNPIAESIKKILNISQTDNYNSILWAVLLTAVYLLFLFLILIITCKPLQKVEKVTLRLGDGRVREGRFNILKLFYSTDIKSTFSHPSITKS